MIPSSAEKTLLRTRPQSSRLWLSIYEPEVVLAARGFRYCSSSIQAMLLQQVTEGSYLAVEPGMTMYVGSTLGASDLARLE